MTNSGPRIHWQRVAWIAAALALCGGAFVGKPLLFPEPVPQPKQWTPWIGLPSGGMDASSQPLRGALKQLEGMESMEKGEAPGEILIRRCGEQLAVGNDADTSEIYVARIADSAFGGARAWHVRFAVEGEQVKVAIESEIAMDPPPPPPPGAIARGTYFSRPQTAITDAVFTKAQLQPIADAWHDPGGWGAAQPDTECQDGMPAILEACVRGQYGMRDLRCSPTANPMRLWQAIQRLLPAPGATGRPPGGVD
ncbi:MAG TPA: hypothetical protein VGH80_15840 [Xanthomonadaceae bacterium]|jgi:hypothetical protein